MPSFTIMELQGFQGTAVKDFKNQHGRDTAVSLQQKLTFTIKALQGFKALLA